MPVGGSHVRLDFMAAWAIAKKDLKSYYARPGAVMFGIMFPLFMFLSFIVGRNIPVEQALPGLTSMVVMFSASSIGPFSIPLERRLKTFDRLLSAPISFHAILAGKVFAGALYGLAVGAVPVAVGTLALGAEVPSPGLLILDLAVSSACFAAMGVMFASFPTENPGNVTIAMNFVRLPMLFVSGVFVPLSGASLAVRLASLVSPLTYSNDLARVSYGVGGMMSAVLDVAGLLAFAAVFVALGAVLHRRLREWAEASGALRPVGPLSPPSRPPGLKPDANLQRRPRRSGAGQYGSRGAP